MHATDALYKQVKVPNNMLITIAVVTYDVSVKTQESGTNSHRKLKNNVFLILMLCFLKYFLFENILKYFFYFLKIIFDINATHRNDLKTLKNIKLKQKNKTILNLFSKTFLKYKNK